MNFFRSNQPTIVRSTGTINSTIRFNEPVELELPPWTYPIPEVVTRKIPIDPNIPQPQLKWHNDKHMYKKKRYQDGSAKYKAT